MCIKGVVSPGCYSTLSIHLIRQMGQWDWARKYCLWVSMAYSHFCPWFLFLGWSSLATGNGVLCNLRSLEMTSPTWMNLWGENCVVCYSWFRKYWQLYLGLNSSYPTIEAISGSTGEVISSNPTGEVISSDPSGEVIFFGSTGEVISSDLTGEVISSDPTGKVISSSFTGEVISSDPSGEVISSSTGEVISSDPTAEVISDPTGEVISGPTR